jgi:hypothetical protein
MNVRLDALIAEIARTLDVSLLRHDPRFATLPRPQRMHLIVRTLARCDIARGEKYGGREVRRWRPSRRLERNLGVKGHGIPDEIERIEAPIAISTLVDELSDLLKENGEAIDEVTHYVLRLFGMHELEFLEYRGKRDGLCQFERSSSRI